MNLRTVEVTDLIINIGCPKASYGAIIWISWEDGGPISPHLIDVLDVEKGLTNGLIAMDENWDFLENKVGFEKKLAFRCSIFMEKLIFDGLYVEGDLNPIHIWT